mmetsp:Transcript_26034/g.61820  ORF Transcript_26034/g.61820 Transcript_26034/m.61820 type:complete len:529 (-) Transcript_26034:420-2006(-)
MRAVDRVVAVPSATAEGQVVEGGVGTAAAEDLPQRRRGRPASHAPCIRPPVRDAWRRSCRGSDGGRLTVVVLSPREGVARVDESAHGNALDGHAGAANDVEHERLREEVRAGVDEDAARLSLLAKGVLDAVVSRDSKVTRRHRLDRGLDGVIVDGHRRVEPVVVRPRPRRRIALGPLVRVLAHDPPDTLVAHHGVPSPAHPRQRGELARSGEREETRQQLRRRVVRHPLQHVRAARSRRRLTPSVDSDRGRTRRYGWLAADVRVRRRDVLVGEEVERARYRGRGVGRSVLDHVVIVVVGAVLRHVHRDQPLRIRRRAQVAVPAAVRFRRERRSVVPALGGRRALPVVLLADRRPRPPYARRDPPVARLALVRREDPSEGRRAARGRRAPDVGRQIREKVRATLHLARAGEVLPDGSQRRRRAGPAHAASSRVLLLHTPVLHRIADAVELPAGRCGNLLTLIRDAASEGRADQPRSKLDHIMCVLKSLFQPTPIANPFLEPRCSAGFRAASRIVFSTSPGFKLVCDSNR